MSKASFGEENYSSIGSSSYEAYDSSRKDILLPDGRELVFVENTSPASIHTTDTNFHNFEHNLYSMHMALLRMGILETNEIPATDVSGNVLSDCTALYVDSRISKKSVTDLEVFVLGHYKELFYVDPSDSPESSTGQFEEVIGYGIEVLGLSDLIGAYSTPESVKSVGKTVIDQVDPYDTGL